MPWGASNEVASEVALSRQLAAGTLVVGAAVVVAAGVPFGINAWKNLLTDKRSYDERFGDCRYEHINKKMEATDFSGLTIPEAGAAAENFFEEATAECRAMVAP